MHATDTFALPNSLGVTEPNISNYLLVWPEGWEVQFSDGCYALALIPDPQISVSLSHFTDEKTEPQLRYSN